MEQLTKRENLEVELMALEDSVDELRSKFLKQKNDDELCSSLGEIEDFFTNIKMLMKPKKQINIEYLRDKTPSVAALVQSLYELNQAANFTTEGKPSTIADYQDLAYPYIELLAEVLGIELKD